VQKPHKKLGDTVQVVSLRELMFEYAINVLVHGVSGLLAASTVLAYAKNPLSPADPRNLKSLSKVLFGLHSMGKDIGLDSSLLEQIATLNKLVSRENCKTPTNIIAMRVDLIVQGILGNLDSKKFLFVPTDQASYWENRANFGDDSLAELGEAAGFEAIEAGNCYAAARWTACVFHSMRVAEYGLRKIAQRSKVTLSDDGKRYPLEYGDWNKVIGAIRKKIEERRRLPIGPKKAEALRRYSDLADHCEYMKDIWRNEVSHARRRYNKTESLAVMNRVREFVQSIPVKPKTQKAASGIS
jgi:hypothetical protein